MQRNNINPNTLKGYELLERTKSLMGVTTISENKLNKSAVELTKRGPDGKIYGIVREKHEYFIKTTDKVNNINESDFNYIGGLANYREKVYPTYSKASKGLNLMFISLAESLGKTNSTNILENDNLIEYHSYRAEEDQEEEDENIDEVEMSETDKAIDKMLVDEPVVENYIQNNRLKITKAINAISENELRNKQFKTLIESLSESEKNILIDNLKKKV
jgi:hypothetical protein